MKLYIGNKNYSSWSFRPWIAMKTLGVEFEENLVPFDDAAGNPEFRKFSPTGKVPVLTDDAVVVWESLSILEYLADRFPDLGFWPDEGVERAAARSIANEMHAGYHALRHACPMNIRREIRPIAVSEEVHEEVERIETIWSNCLDTIGGPFLFGDFSNADAMFAPVVNRLETYGLSDHPAVLAYTQTMKALPAWQEWQAAAIAEPWVVPGDEV
jgi:glutathione S-transferase